MCKKKEDGLTSIEMKQEEDANLFRKSSTLEGY